MVWGAMLALGSYSIGESFVPRNAGLKATWQDSAWRVRIIFMDHDSLCSAGPEQSEFRADEVMAGTIHDETHIFGHALPHRTNIGAVTCLESIYRVQKPTARRGMQQLRAAMLSAYRKTRARLPRTAMLTAAYLAQMRDFEKTVRAALDAQFADEWEEREVGGLTAKGYSEDQARAYTATVKEHARFFREHAFLYEQAP